MGYSRRARAPPLNMEGSGNRISGSSKRVAVRGESLPFKTDGDRHYPMDIPPGNSPLTKKTARKHWDA